MISQSFTSRPIVVALLVAVLGALFAGCATAEPEGRAIDIPHTVTVIDPVQFVLDRDQAGWYISALCTNAATTQAPTEVRIRLASPAGSTEGTAMFDENVACAEGEPLALRVDSAAVNLQVGERLEVAVSVAYPDQSFATSTCYAVDSEELMREIAASEGCFAATS
ncbi:MAG: hypothetical protein HC822_20765 [Oscillochloris sp.]|nr:hypothetical protein [Oscillochloris sp.]